VYFLRKEVNDEIYIRFFSYVTVASQERPRDIRMSHKVPHLNLTCSFSIRIYTKSASNVFIASQRDRSLNYMKAIV